MHFSFSLKDHNIVFNHVTKLKIYYKRLYKRTPYPTIIKRSAYTCFILNYLKSTLKKIHFKIVSYLEKTISHNILKNFSHSIKTRDSPIWKLNHKDLLCNKSTKRLSAKPCTSVPVSMCFLSSRDSTVLLFLLS